MVEGVSKAGGIANGDVLLESWPLCCDLCIVDGGRSGGVVRLASQHRVPSC